MKVRTLPTDLYENAERQAGLMLAALSAILMAVAAFPGIMTITPRLADASLAYAEMAGLGAITATIAMMHARHRIPSIRRVLFASTIVWWTAALVLFPARPVVAVIGMVAVLCCVASLGAEGELTTEMVGAAPRISLWGRARSHGA